MTPPKPALVAQQLLQDHRVGWSVGRLGAIAEFYRDEHEPVVAGPHALVTARGAIGLNLSGQPCRIVAGETLGHSEDGWSQWIAFCLPLDRSPLDGRSMIAELGPDGAAPRQEDRNGILFDLGIGGPFYRLCVRADSNGAVAACLRSAAGKQLLNERSVLEALVSLSPARVFESKLARIEVHQAIAAHGTASPQGPHTHVLPALLAIQSTPEGNAPVGWIEQAVAYPPHPGRDAYGDSKPFDRAQYNAFQQWLARYGDSGHLLVKNLVMEAVRADASPALLEGQIDQGRHEAVRIALRQIACRDGRSKTLERWRGAFGD